MVIALTKASVKWLRPNIPRKLCRPRPFVLTGYQSMFRRYLFSLSFVAACLAGLPATVQAQQQKGASGLTLPRFVSLKSDPVNLRTGPGRRYPKAWVFRRAGLPVEIIQEHKAWRRIRDSEGANGWVLRTLLSRRRTALVLPWAAKSASDGRFVDLKSSSSSNSSTVARLEAGALVSIKSCSKVWCEAAIHDFSGYLPQKSLWGVYPDEALK